MKNLALLAENFLYENSLKEEKENSTVVKNNKDEDFTLTVEQATHLLKFRERLNVQSRIEFDKVEFQQQVEVAELVVSTW